MADEQPRNWGSNDGLGMSATPQALPAESLDLGPGGSAEAPPDLPQGRTSLTGGEFVPGEAGENVMDPQMSTMEKIGTFIEDPLGLKGVGRERLAAIRKDAALRFSMGHLMIKQEVETASGIHGARNRAVYVSERASAIEKALGTEAAEVFIMSVDNPGMYARQFDDHMNDPELEKRYDMAMNVTGDMEKTLEWFYGEDHRDFMYVENMRREGGRLRQGVAQLMSWGYEKHEDKMKTWMRDGGMDPRELDALNLIAPKGKEGDPKGIRLTGGDMDLVKKFPRVFADLNIHSTEMAEHLETNYNVKNYDVLDAEGRVVREMGIDLARNPQAQVWLDEGRLRPRGLDTRVEETTKIPLGGEVALRTMNEVEIATNKFARVLTQIEDIVAADRAALGLPGRAAMMADDLKAVTTTIINSYTARNPTKGDFEHVLDDGSRVAQEVFLSKIDESSGGLIEKATQGLSGSLGLTQVAADAANLRSLIVQAAYAAAVANGESRGRITERDISRFINDVLGQSPSPEQFLHVIRTLKYNAVENLDDRIRVDGRDVYDDSRREKIVQDLRERWDIGTLKPTTPGRAKPARVEAPQGHLETLEGIQSKQEWDRWFVNNKDALATFEENGPEMQAIDKLMQEHYGGGE